MKEDVRYALRQLRRSPGFTIVALATLAVGIGATTAIFSALYSVVLRPLPFADAERLVRVYATSPATTSADELSPRDFVAWRAGARAFNAMSAIETRAFTLGGGAFEPERVRGVRTTAAYFPMLGIEPLLGRGFTAEEDRPGGGRVVLLSHGFWLRRFGGERQVLGSTVTLDAEPYEVIGVLPPEVGAALGPIDIWLPLALTAEQAQTVDTGYLDGIARLRTGVTLEAAERELDALAARLSANDPNRARGARLVDYARDLVGAYRERLFVLLGAVALVLLIACVNVSNLLLARSLGRTQELAVRRALGASRGRAVRQLVTESVLLGMLGGGAGVALAHGALLALKTFGPEGVPRLEEATIDGAALACALIVSLLCGIAFGVLPAMRATTPAATSALRHGSRLTASRERMRHVLVAFEVALCLALLVGAGLLIRSALLTARVDPGLDPANLWTGRLTLPPAAYPTEASLVQASARIVESAATIPGATSAAAISVVPFAGIRTLGLFVPEGRPLDRDNALLANLRLVSPAIFDVLRVPVLRGRAFTDRDDATAPAVVIVNDAFARAAWPGEDAIGKRLYGAGTAPDGSPLAREVVGVVAGTREDGLREEPRPAVFYPFRQVQGSLWQAIQNSLFLLVRSETDALALTEPVRAAVRTVDAGLAVSDAATMEQRLSTSLATARFNTLLLTTLAAVGLLLAVIGVYGLLAYFVTQRRREIGVRLALGATTGRIVALIFAQGLRPVGTGVAIGIGLAVALSRVLASQLYGIRATDPVTFVTVAGIVALAALAAATVPGRRAARVRPRDALF